MFVTKDGSGLPSAPLRRLFGSSLAKLGLFRCATSHPNFAREGEITDHCFVFPRTAVWIQHDGSEPFVADPTRVTLYNRGQQYRRAALSPDGDCCDWITLSDDHVRDVVSQIDPWGAESESRPIRWQHAPSDAATYALQRRLHRYVLKHERPDPLVVEETAVCLFARVLRAAYAVRSGPCPQRPHRRPSHRELIEAVSAYLNQTFAEGHTLTSIAKHVGVSVFHLCRLFRQYTGSTIHAYRHQLRVRNALEHLEEADSDLLTVALDLGYSGHSHFTSVFRRHFGKAPSEVRAVLQRAGLEDDRSGSFSFDALDGSVQGCRQPRSS